MTDKDYIEETQRRVNDDTHVALENWRRTHGLGFAERVVQFENMVMRIDNPSITSEEREVIRAVLQKLAGCALQKARLGDLYEQKTLTQLNVSCEMVGFNDRGQVYLVQRPSREESSYEPNSEEKREGRRAGRGGVCGRRDGG